MSCSQVQKKPIRPDFKLGKINYEEKDFGKAIFELTYLIDIIPEDFEKKSILTFLGLAYIGTGSYEDARSQFAQVINVDYGEHREKCLYLMGYSYICEQKYQDAVKPFNDLLNLYPKSKYTDKARSFLEKIQKQ